MTYTNFYYSYFDTTAGKIFGLTLLKRIVCFSVKNTTLVTVSEIMLERKTIMC